MGKEEEEKKTTTTENYNKFEHERQIHVAAAVELVQSKPHRFGATTECMFILFRCSSRCAQCSQNDGKSAMNCFHGIHAAIHWDCDDDDNDNIRHGLASASMGTQIE